MQLSYSSYLINQEILSYIVTARELFAVCSMLVVMNYFRKNSASEVSPRVFDLPGNEGANPVNKEQEAGVYEVSFDAGKLASGTYIPDNNRRVRDVKENDSGKVM